MTAVDVKRIALQLANTYWVRYYLHLNYPHDPQAACIQVRAHDGVIVQFDDEMAAKEMAAAGFRFESRFGVLGYHADLNALRSDASKKCPTCNGTGAEFPGHPFTLKCEECNGKGVKP